MFLVVCVCMYVCVCMREAATGSTEAAQVEVKGKTGVVPTNYCELDPETAAPPPAPAAASAPARARTSSGKKGTAVMYGRTRAPEED
jgi:hypothetical protein